MSEQFQRYKQVTYVINVTTQFAKFKQKVKLALNKVRHSLGFNSCLSVNLQFVFNQILQITPCIFCGIIKASHSLTYVLATLESDCGWSLLHYMKHDRNDDVTAIYPDLNLILVSNLHFYVHFKSTFFHCINYLQLFITFSINVY